MAVQQMCSEGSSFVFYSDLKFIDLHTGGKKLRKKWKMSAFGNDCHFFYNAACIKVIYKTIEHLILYIVHVEH